MGSKSVHSPTVNIVWFKRDLRVQDHAPLSCASVQGAVIPLYVVEPDYWRLPDVSRRHWHFIHDCLIELQAELASRGAPLVCRMGRVVEVLEDLRRKFGHIALWSHEETGNDWTFARDRQVSAWCKAHAIEWYQIPSNGVVRRLKNRDGWSALRDKRMAEPVILAPYQLSAAMDVPAGSIPSKDDWMFGESVQSVQSGGRSEGMRVLDSFLKQRANKYMATISKPGVSARHCSRLSAHIAYGTLSVREIEQATKARMAILASDADPAAKSFRKNLSAFLSRLAWRCHFVQKLEQQPSIEFRCMHSAFEGMREPHFNQDFFEAWATGHTGYPLIDAAMRSLHANGWINFRMRAMLVSFASYNLWLDWRQTAPHLARLFTDYEPGIHLSQFQMQSGVTGINTLRIYNPIKQSMDHDPEGKFIRRYVPELSTVSDQWIHEPWRLPEPPPNYAKPLVDHETAIKMARDRIAACRKVPDFIDSARQVRQKLGSRAKQPERRAKVIKDKSQLSFDM